MSAVFFYKQIVDRSLFMHWEQGHESNGMMRGCHDAVGAGETGII